MLPRRAPEPGTVGSAKQELPEEPTHTGDLGLHPSWSEPRLAHRHSPTQLTGLMRKHQTLVWVPGASQARRLALLQTRAITVILTHPLATGGGTILHLEIAAEISDQPHWHGQDSSLRHSQFPPIPGGPGRGHHLSQAAQAPHSLPVTWLNGSVESCLGLCLTREAPCWTTASDCFDCCPSRSVNTNGPPPAHDLGTEDWKSLDPRPAGGVL